MRAADARDRADVVEAVDGADLRRLRDRGGHGLAGMDEGGRMAADGAVEQRRVDAAECAVDGRQACAAGEVFRRAALVLQHVRLAVGEGDAAGPGERRHRQRIGGGAGGDEIDGHLALEDLGNPGGDLAVEIAGAVGRCEARRLSGKGGRDRRMGARPVVRCEVHGDVPCRCCAGHVGRVAQFEDLRPAGKAPAPFSGGAGDAWTCAQENYATPADANMKFLDPLPFLLKASCEPPGFLAYAI